MIVPFISLVFLISFAVWWCYTAAYLYSCGEDNEYGVFERNNTTVLAFFNFGFVWIFSFLLSLNYFIIASTTCIWYFG